MRNENAHTTETKGDVTINFNKVSMKCGTRNFKIAMQNGEITYCSKFEKKEEN